MGVRGGGWVARIARVALAAGLAAAVLAPVPAAAQAAVDYDFDNDGLIEVGSLEQLDAIRWDLDGDGGSADAGYATAFPNPAAGMGCPDTDSDANSPNCLGYELSADLDFDSNNDLIVDSRDTFGGNWSPIGDSGDSSDKFNAVFEGNGKVLSNMRVRAPSNYFGLFGYVGNSGVVRKLGLQGVDVASGGRHRGQNYGGALAGALDGRVESVYSTGRVDANSYVGGLVGSLGGVIAGSYSSASVVAGIPGHAGGLAGAVSTGISGKLVGVVAGYATGRVSARSGVDPQRAGGLVGVAEPWSPGAVVIVASYSRGVVPFETLSFAGGVYSKNLGGMLGGTNSEVTVTDSYWDTDASQSPTRSAGGDGKTTTELKTPTDYAGIYANWDVDVDDADGDNDRTTGGDSPWDFGTSGQYPALKVDFDGDGAATVAEFGSQLRSGVDYDTDDDRLIEVDSLAQLNAIRWDLDGDGGSTDAGYATAFPNAAAGMGCPTTAADADDDDCGGYELSTGLDFDSDDDGDVDSDDAFSGDWTPIGDSSNGFGAVFEGNGKVLSNLRIRASSGDFGLFGYVGSGGVVRRLGLEGVDIESSSGSNGGAVVGYLSGGRLEGVYAAGTVTGSSYWVGGLVGSMRGNAGSSQVVRSYANVAVSAFAEAGGLVGRVEAKNAADAVLVAGSYATGRVQGSSQVGGLIGKMDRSSGSLAVRAVYSTGQVPNEALSAGVTPVAAYYRKDFGGLIGANGDQYGSEGTVEHAYWDEESSRSTRTLFHQDGGAAKTSLELKSPVGYAGIYQDWDGDLDGDGIADDWWDFGTARHYPVLKADFDGDGSPTADEFGSQIRFIPVDYDRDGDGLIEISDLDRLNAMRWDLDGDGAPRTDKSADYEQAFADPAPGMGCPDTDSDANSANCLGYELSADLDFDTDGDGDVDAGDDYPSWVPIGTTDAAVCVARGDAPDAATAAADMSVCHFRTAFEGNGRVLENLRIVGSGDDVGLFGATLAGSVVRGVGLLDADVAGDTEVGALVGNAKGVVEASFSTGRVAGSSRVGGLVGLLRGSLRAGFSYSDVSGAPGGSRIGGLVGHNDAGDVLASYATGSVSGAAEAGGLVGGNGGLVRASYSTGRVAASGPAQARGAVGALVGAASAGGTAVDSYWDVWTSGLFHSAGGVGHTSPELTTPTGYTGIYSAWNIDIDGDSVADNPWDMGFITHYPMLAWELDGDGSPSINEFQSQRNIQERTAPRRDFDRDDDRLIEVGSLAQLNAMRWDLDGDGSSTDAGYAAAFPYAEPGMGCPDTDSDASTADCEGFELVEDLDFDSDSDGDVDADDAFGGNWSPIGSQSNRFVAKFDGGGHLISRLRIRSSSDYYGLFNTIGQGGVVRRVGLVDVDIGPTGSNHQNYAGAVAGELWGGRIEDSFSTGAVSAFRYAGGLAGSIYTNGRIIRSYSNAAATAASFAAGGLVGQIHLPNAGDNAEIIASYATGRVIADSRAGGLVGQADGGAAIVVRAAYSTGRVPVEPGPSYSKDYGGLIGDRGSTGAEATVTDSYWDTDRSKSPRSAGGTGKTLLQLQSPTGYTGIYANWNADLDGSGGADDWWDFGTASQYPALKSDFNDDGAATAAEFGPQVRIITNQAPTFAAGASVTVTVRESAPAGSAAGSPVTADDPDGDTLTYTLGGADAADFAIDSRTAQIRTAGALDHATKALYAVTVTASDPSGATATIAVAIAVSNVNERPEFAAATAARSVRENAPRGTAVGLPVTADDPDLHIPPPASASPTASPAAPAASPSTPAPRRYAPPAPSTTRPAAPTPSP